MAQIKDEILLKKIALCIKQIRKETAITLDDFYVDTGIHLARIEQGKTNISITTLASICNYFDMGLNEFFSLVEKNG
ncbi:MAG: helix-turn-helix domain-containing protein [Flavobacteriaceae bacterium]|nr:helix-turn-helix domain-containing protein [Flavobacteriaceae bacterium]